MTLTVSFILHLALESWVLEGWGRKGATPLPPPLTPSLTAMTFQIAAQELSDNRVITLSLAGRKLDKKVRQAGRGFHEPLCFPSPGPWGLASLATPFSFPMGVRLSTEPHTSDFLPLWGESVLPLKGKQDCDWKPSYGPVLSHRAPL